MFKFHCERPRRSLSLGFHGGNVGRRVRAVTGLLALSMAPLGSANAATNSTEALKPAKGAIGESSPNFFGAVALKVPRTPLDARWASVKKSSPALGNQVQAAIAKARTQSHIERIKTINVWVNDNIAYVTDLKQSGVEDNWSDAASTLRKRKGDCEDVAILKRHLLQLAGVSTEEIYFSLVRDLVRRADHAVLIVKTDEQAIMLDNTTNELLDAVRRTDYRPIFTYGERGRWLYGYRI